MQPTSLRPTTAATTATTDQRPCPCATRSNRLLPPHHHARQGVPCAKPHTLLDARPGRCSSMAPALTATTGRSRGSCASGTIAAGKENVKMRRGKPQATLPVIEIQKMECLYKGWRRSARASARISLRARRCPCTIIGEKQRSDLIIYAGCTVLTLPKKMPARSTRNGKKEIYIQETSLSQPVPVAPYRL